MGITAVSQITTKKILELAKKRNPAGTDYLYDYQEIAKQAGNDLTAGNISTILRGNGFRRKSTNGKTASVESLKNKIAELQEKLELAENQPVAEYNDDESEITVKNVNGHNAPAIIKAVRSLVIG